MASSNNKITGSFKNALAIATLCFSPSEIGSSFSPSSPLMKNLSISAFCAALKTSSFVASYFPYKIFSYILLLNKEDS